MKNSATNGNKFFYYLISAAAVAFITFLGEFLKTSFLPNNLAMLYLLAVVISAVWWGRGPAIFTSILSVLCLDFFLIPPHHDFAVGQVQDLFTFTVLLIVGLVIATLASKTRRQAIEVRERDIQAQALRQTEKLQTALLNSISHDLKTPLVSITGALSGLLQDPLLQDEQTRKALLESAYSESRHLNRLVGDLLDMTRIESGTLKLHLESCYVQEIIRASLQELRDKLDKREIRVKISGDFPRIPADFKLMVAVFTNIIDNAVKYSPPVTPVEIEAAGADGRMKISVRDKGFGIPPEDLERIFDKFYRAIQPRRVTGTGLGLSICRGIVEAHGGKILAQNNPDGGSMITVFLPLETAAS